MTKPIIQVERLSKRYRIGVRESETESLGQTLKDTVLSPFRYLREMSRPPTEAETLWAIRNISFQINPGEVVGLIGRNGAGKSTLLKILARITEPSEGRAVLHGKMGSLLEVGTGFHPDFTGRENVYMNGAILGMKKREIDRKFDEIVAFSEVEKFLDTPVKRYSSGMQVRLAFAVAAHLEPEILIVDEVLAVGDAAFQRKCLGKMGQIAGEGRTVLYVSHNLGSVQSLCRRALWLQDGVVKADGPAEEVIHQYLEGIETRAERGELILSHDKTLRIVRVSLLDRNGKETTLFRPGESLTVEVEYNAQREIVRPYFWLGFSGALGNLFTANTLLDNVRPEVLQSNGVLRLVIPQLPLMPNQQYVVRLGGYAADAQTPLFAKTDVAYFRVIGTAESIGMRGEVAEHFMQGAPSMLVPYQWVLPDGKIVPVDAIAQVLGQS